MTILNRLQRAGILIVVIFTQHISFETNSLGSTTKEKIFSIISTIDLEDPDNFYYIESIEGLGKDSFTILVEMMRFGSLSDRWASIVLLPSFARKDQRLKETVLSALKESKEEEDTLKMLRGVQLASFGEKKGIELLNYCLESEENTNFGEPPEPVKERSFLYLKHYTDFSGSDIKDWKVWWEAKHKLLLWNEEEKKFR